MINTNFIKDKIEYEDFFKNCENLNQLSGKNRFLKYILFNNNQINIIIYIGKLNSFHFFLPIDLNDFRKFLLFCNTQKFNSLNINFSMIENINLYENNILFFNKKTTLIKKTNQKLTLTEKQLFNTTLSEIKINFEELLNEYSKCEKFYQI